MKFGRKGFMLAEVVVVAVVIATVLVTLFTGLNNISSAYETRNRYYDVDSLYVAMEVNDIVTEIILMERGTLDNFVTSSDIIYGSISQEIDYYIQDFDTFYYYTIGDSVISYISPYDVNEILSLSSHDGKTEETFSDYLEYLSSNLDFEEDYDYVIIVERRENNNIDDCYYYALKLKY